MMCSQSVRTRRKIPCIQKAFLLNTDVTHKGSVPVRVCARTGGVGQRSLWIEDQGCSSWRMRANHLRLWRLVKENWHAKKCLILRIRMSGYMFFGWPGVVPYPPGPTIKLFRDYFSLWHHILCSLSQCLLVQRNVLGKSCPTMSKKFDFGGILSFHQFISLVWMGLLT